MTCTFFGHRRIKADMRDELKELIMRLIDDYDTKQFLVGNNGAFDALVQGVLDEICRTRDDVSYSIVLSYVDELALSGDQHATIFPEGLEYVPRRFAISKRNEWLIKSSDYVIAYVKYSVSNSFRWTEKAMKKGLIVFNLA